MGAASIHAETNCEQTILSGDRIAALMKTVTPDYGRILTSLRDEGVLLCFVRSGRPARIFGCATWQHHAAIIYEDGQDSVGPSGFPRDAMEKAAGNAFRVIVHASDSDDDRYRVLADCACEAPLTLLFQIGLATQAAWLSAIASLLPPCRTVQIISSVDPGAWRSGFLQ